MFIEINQLKDAGFSQVKIAQRLGINRKTVAKYWNMEPGEFSQALTRAGSRKRKLDKHEETIIRWLKRFPDMTAAQVEDWLKERFKDDSFKERTVRSYVAHLRDKHGISKQAESERQYQAIEDPPPGDQMQLDFGETRVYCETQNSKKLYVLGCVLSHSRQKYGEWAENPLKTSDLISMLLNCFDFYEGVPREIVIDQDKLMVVSENYGEIIYTQQFEMFRRKMGFKLSVCRGSDPESKGRIEAVIKYIKFGFAANRTFTNISSWNQACLDWLDRTANKKVHGTTKKIPAEVFALEKQYLKPIPSLWSLPTDSVTRTVRKDNTIVYKSNRYSVPIGTYALKREVGIQDLNGKLIITDPETMQIIAEHKVSAEKGKLVQNRSHLRDNNASIDELHTKILRTLDLPNLSDFLDVIRKEKGKYVRDQYNLILQLEKNHSHNSFHRAYHFCLENSLYSAVSLKDAVEYFSVTPEVAATSEFSTDILPEYLRITATSRDITEYANLQKGGEAR